MRPRLAPRVNTEHIPVLAAQILTVLNLDSTSQIQKSGPSRVSDSHVSAETVFYEAG